MNRSCPICKKELTYKSKYTYQTALKNNKKCYSCSKLKGESSLVRNCPSCNAKLYYTKIGNRNIANKNNRTCKSCTQIKQKQGNIYFNTDERKWCRRCGDCNVEMCLYSRSKCAHSEILNIKCGSCRQKHPIPSGGLRRICNECGSTIIYKRIGDYNTAKKYNYGCGCKTRNGTVKYWKGKRLSPETRRKLRLATIADLDSKFPNGWSSPNYNKLACKIFDEINSTLKWNGIHAENGGEFKIKSLGYWVDYYDPANNIVIEYDDKSHNTKKRKERDELRQVEIINYLNCKFYRIKYNQHWKDILCEYL